MKLIFTLSICFAATLFSKTFAQINVQDSLALVDLYDSTQGKGWTNHTYWLTKKPVKKWYGITTKNSRVTGIQLADNNLVGSIAPSIGSLTGLDTLNLSSNQHLYNSGIPASMGNLNNLLYLNLGDDFLVDTIPSFFGNLTKLQSLILYADALTGSIPASIANLKNLRILYLQSNFISGGIPPFLGELSALTNLNLEENRLHGSIPSELGNLNNLHELTLFDDSLTGNIPSSLGNLRSLITLDANSNQLSGSLPASLGNLENLEDLSFSDNKLSGNIPPELGYLSNLHGLGLEINQLTGSIPASFGNLKNLISLGLDRNQLTGSIPGELGNLDSLTILYLFTNYLTGSLPKQLGNLKKLQHFVLSYNNLSDSLPTELFELKNLQELRLDHNNFTGNLPAALDSLDQLQYFYIENNDLHGTIPYKWGSHIVNPLLVANYNFFTFDGIENIVKNNSPAILYAPQGIMPLDYKAGKLSVYAGGTLSNNTYYWYKDGALFTTITGDSTLQVTQTGNYNVAVTNAIAKQLTLYSDTLDITVLPVTLLSFTAQKENSAVFLQWQTANEINNSYFGIERSANGGLFSSIGEQAALKTASINNYAFTDNAPLQGNNYYRLKQVDKDGKFTYSNIVTVDFSNAGTFAVYPNPASSSLNVTVSTSNSSSQLMLFDVNGKTVISEAVASNITSKQINISKLPAGVYNVVLVQDGKQQTVKIVKK